MEVAEIFKEFNRSLLAYIKSKIRSQEDAEDILQNVFIRISSNIGKLSDDQMLKSWIFTITRNAIVDYYRANASKTKIAIAGSVNDEVIDSDDPDTTKGLEGCLSNMIALLRTTGTSSSIRN